MKEQLIGFETANLSKEKGFDGYCNFVYETNNKIRQVVYYEGNDDNLNEGFVKNTEIEDSQMFDEIFTAPSQSLLQKWLREEHDIFISINTVSEERWLSDDIGDIEHIPVHKYRIIKNKDNFRYDVIDWSAVYDTYEEALEIGLQEALKLI